MAEMTAREFLMLQSECCKENEDNCDCKLCPAFVICSESIRERAKEDIKTAIELMTEYKAIKHPFGWCKKCGADFNSELRNEYEIKYCPWCGAEFEDMEENND